jgi:hypothetical protein
MWELPQRDAGRAGETVPQASRASLPPVPVPNPLGRGAGGRHSTLYDAPQLGRASCPMIRIAISAEAFEAIARTLPLGSVGYENKIDEEGQRLVDR